VKISTAQGPMLVTFTQKVADLDVLLEDAYDVASRLTGLTYYCCHPGVSLSHWP
jgi:hypothetical protein